MKKLETRQDENSTPRMQKRQIKYLVNNGKITMESYVTTQREFYDTPLY